MTRARPKPLPADQLEEAFAVAMAAALERIEREKAAAARESA